MQKYMLPDILKKGDAIAIIAPASIVKDEYIDTAARYIERKGYKAIVMPYAKGPHEGNYASSRQHRLDDLLAAWTMPEVKAILCARGGYGAVHLLAGIPSAVIKENPKWLIGFSDISALHAMTLANGLVSVHGPMAKDWQDGKDSGSELIFDILEGRGMPEYEFKSSDNSQACEVENIIGDASGMLIGGNVAVLDGLAATPFDMFAKALQQDCILFIEDINEPIYKIERILYRLYLQGVISRIRGMVVGQFTDCAADRNFRSMEEMIRNFMMEYASANTPVAFGFPGGHGGRNKPLLLGSSVSLKVNKGISQLIING